jgi:formylglycine-generating enzyme required for sulfatase activity
MKPVSILVGLLAIPVFVTAADAQRSGGDIVDVEVAPGVAMKFCWIPAGEAQLGSPAAERDECLKVVKADAERLRLATEPEERRGKFKTNGFWLGKYAVTQGEWTALMGTNPSVFQVSHAAVKKDGISDTSRFPVDNVSWDDCQRLLANLNRKSAPATLGSGKFVLPHEDHWEYACRGGLGNQKAYYFGASHNGTFANSNGQHMFATDVRGPNLARPAVVGSYEKAAPHPWGLCDMHGNMWQWCSNVYDTANDNKVVRGGTWSSGCRGARSACRTGRAPAERTMYYGVRVMFERIL